MAFRPIHGVSAVRNAAVLALAVTLIGGCNYGFRGGGGFPAHVRTIFIEPFENRTDRFDLEQQIFRELTDQLPRSLGLRLGPEQSADAVLRGTITRYDDAAQNYLPGQAGGGVQVLQHQVQISVSVEIVDRTQNLILWDSQSLTGRGEYRPQNQTDEAARNDALQSIIRQIVDAAQSQW